MRSLKSTQLLVALVLAGVVLMGSGSPKGLDSSALQELSAAGVDRYLGQFTAISAIDVGDGWTKHTFDSDGGNGPICIAGTDFSVFTRAGNPSRLLIFEQGGGACWQDFYNCNILAEAQEPPAPRVGIWDFDSKDNPFRNYSIVYIPYCDGSVFSGDNDVFDPAFGAAIGVPEAVIRFHRGLRNQTAGMDLAKATFPHASRITVAGSSAGGVGVAGFAPFLVRFLFGNEVKLTVFNDAGPVAVNLDAMGDIAARAADWQFGQFYPASCTECSDMGQGTAIIKWRLDNDSTIREAFYETDADLTNRFFMDLLADPGFRDLVVTEHGLLNAAHPDRYKRFIVAGDTSHTALQTPLFYSQDANGVLLNDWTDDFLVPRPFWVDIVEDPVPVADVGVSVADSPDPVAVGATLTYTLTVTNAGPSLATGVVLEDFLPPGVSSPFVTLLGTGTGCTTQVNTVTCDLGFLDVGGKTMVGIEVTVDPEAFPALTNPASVSSHQFDPNPVNDTDTETTTVTQ